MRLLLFFIFLLLLVSCAPSRDPRTFTSQDPAFSEYVRMFESMYGRSTAHIAIGFSELDGTKAGQCVRWSTGHLEIEIDTSYWNNSNTSRQEKIGLIFHELGHCALYRDHDTSLVYYEPFGSNVPKSLMYPVNFYSPFLVELEAYYYAELFNADTSLSTTMALTKPSSSCIVDR